MMFSDDLCGVMESMLLTESQRRERYQDRLRDYRSGNWEVTNEQ